MLLGLYLGLHLRIVLLQAVGFAAFVGLCGYMCFVVLHVASCGLF